MTEPEIIDELAKSLAVYDGCSIVEDQSAWIGCWKPCRDPEPKSREDYEEEARRFWHCFETAANLLRDHRGYV
jgi:hypothetical protein